MTLPRRHAGSEFHEDRTAQLIPAGISVLGDSGVLPVTRRGDSVFERGGGPPCTPPHGRVARRHQSGSALHPHHAPAGRTTVSALALWAGLGMALAIFARSDLPLAEPGATLQPSDVLFYVFAGGALAGGCAVAFAAAWQDALVGLLGVVLACAALSVLLSADTVATVQVMVTAGGVLLLLLFGWGSVARRSRAQPPLPPPPARSPFQAHLRGPALLVATGAIGWLTLLLAFAAVNAPWWTAEGPVRPTTAAAFGELLLGIELFPFEALSLIALFALLAASVARRVRRSGA